MVKITILAKEIAVKQFVRQDYISLTDMARFKDSQRTDYIIQNWLRNRNTIELLGLWETLNNPDFNPIEFDGFRKQSGLNSFTLTARQWIDKTCAIGIVSKSGRYGGAYAHKDIAYEFATWISVEFKLYLIKEFQRLKEDEQRQLGWDIKRNLAAINYRIHTDAIKENLNTHFIKEGLAQPERLTKLNQIAIHQMTLLIQSRAIARLGDGKP